MQAMARCSTLLPVSFRAAEKGLLTRQKHLGAPPFCSEVWFRWRQFRNLEQESHSATSQLRTYYHHQKKYHTLGLEHNIDQRARSTRASAVTAANEVEVQPEKATDNLEDYLDKVAGCNAGQERIRGPEFLELRGNDSVLGYIHEGFAADLLSFKDTFVHTKDGPIELHPRLDTFEARNEAVASVCLALKEKGLITGWRDELYPVTTGFHEPPHFLLERAAAQHFGITAYGVHMNGYTEDTDGNIQLWVARRSATKQTWPLKLDHLVAGGQPFGLSCSENLVKECQEEAGIQPELARRAKAAGLVSYETVTGNHAKRDVLFVYDLKVPLGFRPQNEDGEVESFELWPLARVADTIRTSNEYKPNVALVIIDFLIRHGFITPDQRGYLELVSRIRTIKV